MIPFHKQDDSTPLSHDASTEALEFSTLKKGWNPDEVRQYIDGILEQHEEELQAVVGRLRTIQEEHEQFQKTMERQVQTLEEARDHSIARAEEFEQRVDEQTSGVAQSEVDELRLALQESERKIQENSGNDVEELLEQLKGAEDYVAETEAVYQERDRLQKALAEMTSQGDDQARIIAEERVRSLENELLKLREQLSNPLIGQASAYAAEEIEKELGQAREEAGQAREEAMVLQDSLSALQQEQTERARDYVRIQEEGNQFKHDLERLKEDYEKTAQTIQEAQTQGRESFRAQAAAEAENERLQKENTRLREEHPDVGETAQRMMKALGASRDQQEAEMQQVLQAARLQAEKTCQEAEEQAGELRRQIISQLDHALAEQQDKLEQNRLARIQAGGTSQELIDSLHQNVENLVEQTQGLLHESVSVVRSRLTEETEALQNYKQQLEETVVQLEIQQQRLVGELRHISHEGGENSPTEPDYAIDGAGISNSPLESFEESDRQNFSPPEETDYQLSNDDSQASESDVQSLDKDQDLAGSSEEIPPEPTEEPAPTPPSSWDPWAGWEPVSAQDLDLEDPTQAPVPPQAPPPPPVISYEAEETTEEPISYPETNYAPEETDPVQDSPDMSISDLANMSAPKRDREEGDNSSHARPTNEPAPRVFTEDD